MVLPIGDATLHESLVSGLPLIDKELVDAHRNDLGSGLASELSKRDRQRFCSSSLAFLPRTNGEHLNLRHGSIFFKCSNATNVSQVAAYAMVSSALQSARESAATNKTGLLSYERFDNNPFVRKVLDPSMFARYNDGVLQASLLRATHKSELDYSASNELSHQFAAICESIFSGHQYDSGEASLEFAFAIATRKVRLRESDVDRLLQQIQAIPVLHTFWTLIQSNLENKNAL